MKIKSIFLAIIFGVIACCSCVSDNFDYTNYVDVKIMAQSTSKDPIYCDLYHNDEIVEYFTLDETNNFIKVVKLVYNDQYTLNYDMNGEKYSQTFFADYSYQTISFSIYVDPSVDEIEDEIIFEF